MGKPSGRTVKQKSVEAAARKARSAEHKNSRMEHYIETLERDRRRLENTCELLAKLAADGPAFYDPGEVVAATLARNAILERLGMNADASPILPK